MPGREGWLHKRSSGFKKAWHRRWFVLAADGGLSYGDHEGQGQDGLRKPTGVAGSSVNTMKLDGCDFCILPAPGTGRSKPLHLRADTLGDKRHWLDALKAAGASLGAEDRVSRASWLDDEEDSDDDTPTASETAASDAPSRAETSTSKGSIPSPEQPTKVAELPCGETPADNRDSSRASSAIVRTHRRGDSHVDPNDETVPAILRDMAQVTWSTDTYDLSAVTAVKAANKEYDRLRRLCRHQTDSLGVLAGSRAKSSSAGGFGPLIAIPPPAAEEEATLDRLALAIHGMAHSSSWDNAHSSRWWRGSALCEPAIAAQLEAGLGRWTGSEGEDVALAGSMARAATTRLLPTGEEVDWASWSSMLAATDEKGLPVTLRTPFRREVEGMRMTAMPMHGTDGEMEGEQDRWSDERRKEDKTKIFCRLNGEGELETAPVGDSAYLFAAVQLGRDNWGVRLLPVKQDGTVGCRCALTWRLTPDGRLLNQGADRFLVLNSRTGDLELRFRNDPAVLGGTYDFEDEDDEEEEDLVYYRWDVPDETGGQHGLRATIRMNLPSWYTPHRRVICCPPLAEIEADALEVWDDPESHSVVARCRRVSGILARRMDKLGEVADESPARNRLLGETARRIVAQVERLTRQARFRQAEGLYRYGVMMLLAERETAGWVGEAAEDTLEGALDATEEASFPSQKCKLLREALVSLTVDRTDGDANNTKGASKKNKGRAVAEDEEESDDEESDEEDESGPPLVLSKQVEVWKYKVEERDHCLPIYVNRRTGRPFLGDGVELRVLEPKDGSLKTPFRDVKKVSLGPLPLRGHGVNPMMMLWCYPDDIKGWVKLLEALSFLTSSGSLGQLSNTATLSATALDKSRSQVSDSTCFSFTVPPHAAGSNGSFHLRMRLAIDTSLVYGTKWTYEGEGTEDVAPGNWLNPLTWCDGFFFQPKLKASTNAVMPPPVVMGEDWERANVIDADARNEELGHTAGTLRVFTIYGLTPSCKASSAKLLGYGQSKVEVQFAQITHEGKVLTWDEAVLDDSVWSSSLKYIVPSESITTILLQKGIDRIRWKGPGAAEDLLVGLASKQKKNTKIFSDFLVALYDRQLEPLYNIRVSPWLANKTLLRMLIDTRGSVLREAAHGMLTTLGIPVPDELQPDQPALKSLEVQLDDGATLACWEIDEENTPHWTDEQRHGSRKLRVDGSLASIDISVPAGRSFLISVGARHSLHAPLRHEDVLWHTPRVRQGSVPHSGGEKGKAESLESLMKKAESQHTGTTAPPPSELHSVDSAPAGKADATAAAAEAPLRLQPSTGAPPPLPGGHRRNRSRTHTRMGSISSAHDIFSPVQESLGTGAGALNPHVVTATLLSGTFSKRKLKTWLGRSSVVKCQLVRKEGNAPLYGDLVIGTDGDGAKVERKGQGHESAFVVHIGNIGWHFTPQSFESGGGGDHQSTGAGVDDSESGVDAAAVVDAWIKRINMAIAQKAPVILRTAKADAKAEPGSSEPNAAAAAGGGGGAPSSAATSTPPRRTHRRTRSSQSPSRRSRDQMSDDASSEQSEQHKTTQHQPFVVMGAKPVSPAKASAAAMVASVNRESGGGGSQSGQQQSSPKQPMELVVQPAAPGGKTERRRLQLWWRIIPSAETAETQLSLLDTALLDLRPGVELFELPGGRVRIVDSESANEKSEEVTSRLRFRGTHQGTRAPTLAPGSRFTLQLTLIEEGAHEVSEIDIKIHVQPKLDELGRNIDPANGGGGGGGGGGGRGGASSMAHGHGGLGSGGAETRWPPLGLSPSPTAGSIMRYMFHAMRHETQSWRNSLLTSLTGGSVADAALSDICGYYVRREVLRTMSHELPSAWQSERPPAKIEDWWARNAGDQVAADGSVTTTERPLTKVLGDVFKARMVEWWSRTRATYNSRAKLSLQEVRQQRLQKKSTIDKILGPCDTDTPGVNYDPDALASADSMDVMYLIMKESMRAEYKDIVREELKPLLRKYAAWAVLGASLFLCAALAVGMLVARAAAGGAPPAESSTCLPQGGGGGGVGDASGSVSELEHLRALLTLLGGQLEVGQLWEGEQ